jgi:phosphate-selective porin
VNFFNDILRCPQDEGRILKFSDFFVKNLIFAKKTSHTFSVNFEQNKYFKSRCNYQYFDVHSTTIVKGNADQLNEDLYARISYYCQFS